MKCWSAGYLAVIGDVPQIRVDEASAYTKLHILNEKKKKQRITNSQLLIPRVQRSTDGNKI